MGHYPFGKLCAWRCGSVARRTNAWIGPHGLRCVALPGDGTHRRWADVPLCATERVDGRPYCQAHLEMAYEQDLEYAAKAISHAATRTTRQQGGQAGSVWW